jgi:hypothetical protein
METTGDEFLGLADDIARLAVQRLLTCDWRWRAHDRMTRQWALAGTILSVLAAVASTLAAVSFVKDYRWLAISLAIAVAVLVPAHNTLSASARVTEHRDAALRFEALANDIERFAQLELGPPLWRSLTVSLSSSKARFDLLDKQIAASPTPRVRPQEGDMVAAEQRANFLTSYLQMANVTIPPRAAWAR